MNPDRINELQKRIKVDEHIFRMFSPTFKQILVWIAHRNGGSIDFSALQLESISKEFDISIEAIGTSTNPSFRLRTHKKDKSNEL